VAKTFESDLRTQARSSAGVHQLVRVKEEDEKEEEKEDVVVVW
jgi:hypothetical protein